MKKSPLIYYKIGLGAVAVFVVILFVIVLSQASGTKQDAKTFNSANNIAISLNNYIDTYERVPDSLSDAKIYNVPSTITYTKLSDMSYRFCVTYKSSSSNFDPGSITERLLTSSSGSDTYSSTGGSYLSINNAHHKGKDCQTINMGTLLNSGAYQDSSTPLITYSGTNTATVN